MTTPKTTLEDKVSRKDVTQRLYQELGGSGRNEGVQIDTKKFTINFDSRKYYNQAHHYLTIPILKEEGKPVSDFMISLSELSSELKNSIEKLDHNNIVYVFKTAVGMIFEDIVKEANKKIPGIKGKSKFKIIDPKFYQKYVYKILKVRLVS